MKSRLTEKLDRIRENPSGRDFIIADAKDADMCWGVPSPGQVSLRGGGTRFRSMPEFHEEIRAVTRQGVVDIMLASISTMSVLAHGERLFDPVDVTPAVRINDTSDVWCPRGGRYREDPSRSFASGFIEEAQYGSLTAGSTGGPVVNLGLYSITFNNNTEADLEALREFRKFRAEAQQKGFRYFLEVFAPNTDPRMPDAGMPAYLNDSICRMLAGVPMAARPVFLKVPYLGPRALEELVSYDPSLVVGVMGGSSGTTCDAFRLIADAQKYGARVALFGRKIKEAEAPLAFISFLRRIVGGEIGPEEAVKAYHGELQAAHIAPRRALAEDLRQTTTAMDYTGNR